MELDDLKRQRQAGKLHRDLQQVLHLPSESSTLDFFISSLTETNPYNSTEEVIAWLQKKTRQDYFRVRQVPISDLHHWSFNAHTGDLTHESGGFFAIRGLEVRTNIGAVPCWTQPIIDQPQVGLLGIIARKINGIMYLLIQAKAEPGNLNKYQLAPTVQATRSNYQRLHKGKSTRFLEYFFDAGRARVLFDQHQSEQGARFYRKRNRNMIVQIPDNEEIEIGADYRWVTLGQLKRLMLCNDTVNMDARSVLANVPFNPEKKCAEHPINECELRDCLENSLIISKPLNDLTLKLMRSACSDHTPVHSMDDLLRRLSQEKFQVELETRLIPFAQVRDWNITSTAISHERNLYFSVIGVRVHTHNREVPTWDQPIVQQHHAGIVGFILRDIDGIIHFLVQLKMECGNLDLLGLAPTVQCLTGSYENGDLPPYVAEMLHPAHSRIIFDTMQSEEGGRFFRESNRNLLLLADESFSLETPPRYLWVTLKQLKHLLALSNFLNIEARSLLAIL